MMISKAVKVMRLITVRDRMHQLNVNYMFELAHT